LSKTALFYCTVHFKKKPKQCHFEWHCGSSSSPGHTKAGEKEVYLPCNSTLTLSLARRLTKPTPLAYNHYEDWTRESCPESGSGVAVQRPPQPPYLVPWLDRTGWVSLPLPIILKGREKREGGWEIEGRIDWDKGEKEKKNREQKQRKKERERGRLNKKKEPE